MPMFTVLSSPWIPSAATQPVGELRMALASALDWRLSVDLHYVIALGHSCVPASETDV